MPIKLVVQFAILDASFPYDGTGANILEKIGKFADIPNLCNRSFDTVEDENAENHGLFVCDSRVVLRWSVHHSVVILAGTHCSIAQVDCIPPTSPKQPQSTISCLPRNIDNNGSNRRI
jgi:hypothetical protein